MKHIKVLGIDLAKNVFQLHGRNAQGKCMLTKRLKRDEVVAYIAKLSPCLIGIEACRGSHYWARLFETMGHQVRIMAPAKVKPYIQSNNKNDPNDAAGIAEAVTRPEMKFVPIKTVEQQDVLLLHRARELVMKQRIAQSNQIRGLLEEYGITIPQGIYNLKRITEILEQKQNQLTERSKIIFNHLYEQFKTYDQQLAYYDQEIERIAHEDELCQKIMEIEGIGPITASAITATIGDAKGFKNGRAISAWLGLVPKQNSSGNKIRLMGISKHGDSYVRKLLVHGGRSVVNNCETKQDKRNQWLVDKKNRCGYNKAAVALANKNARIIGAMMITGESYRPAMNIA